MRCHGKTYEGELIPSEINPSKALESQVVFFLYRIPKPSAQKSHSPCPFQNEIFLIAQSKCHFGSDMSYNPQSLPKHWTQVQAVILLTRTPPPPPTQRKP